MGLEKLLYTIRCAGGRTDSPSRPRQAAYVGDLVAYCHEGQPGRREGESLWVALARWRCWRHGRTD